MHIVLEHRVHYIPTAACDNFKIVGEYIKKYVDLEVYALYIALGVKLFDIKYLVNKRWVARRMCAAEVKPDVTCGVYVFKIDFYSIFNLFSRFR